MLMTAEVLDIQDLDGVGPVTANKLREAGYDSISALAIAPIRELVEKAGLETSVAHKISKAARETIQTDFVTAKQLWERRKILLRLSFGSSNLDTLLGGGLETQAITEFVGEFGAGKVLFIDTEGTFAAQRVFQMAQASGQDADKILDGIIYSRVYNSDHQILTVDHAFKICKEENIKLLVVDSILSHLRGEYIGRESLSERQQRLNSHLHKLLRIAQALNLAVVVTNQVQANPQAFFGDPMRPAGGNIMAHASTHSIMLKKSSQGLRVAKVIDSPYLPESETYFHITEKGVEDAVPRNKRDE